jgi:hypothetical protein
LQLENGTIAFAGALGTIAPKEKQSHVGYCDRHCVAVRVSNCHTYKILPPFEGGLGGIA